MLRTTVFVAIAALLALGTASAHADHDDRRARYVVGGALVGAAVGALAYQSSRDSHVHRYHHYPMYYHPAPTVHYVPAPHYRRTHVHYVPARGVVLPPGHVRGRGHQGRKHRRHQVVYYPY